MPARFFYGWVIVAVAFITMGVGVNARTAFSLLFPPILDEFGWERGVTAGAFSFGFLVSAGGGAGGGAGHGGGVSTSVRTGIWRKRRRPPSLAPCSVISLKDSMQLARYCSRRGLVA